MPEEVLFSDSWHLFAKQHVSLRPNLKIRRQYFRGEPWFTLEDHYTNKYYRFRPAAYAFIARLNGKKTVEEVWKDCLDIDPESSPGQQEVINILAQLSAANLIRSDLPPDSERLFERARKRKLKTVRSQIINFFFIRIPLWDPDAFLNRFQSIGNIIFSKPAFVAWLGLILLSLKVIIENIGGLFDQSTATFAPGNLPLLYISWAFIKFFHEMGHAMACKRFGGEVHTMGIMLLVFTPIPYMDASASWSFRNRNKRLLVAAAGMIVEFAFAAVAVFLWANTGPGLINSLAYNIIFLASISTLLFNINPLLRFDGYYILSDIVDTPNLHQQAKNQIKYLTERYLYGNKGAKPVAHTKREGFWLCFFTVASTIYRIFVLTAIILFIGDQLFEIGLLIAAGGIILWGIVPIGKFIVYLISDKRLDRVRTRAIGVIGGLAVALFILLGMIPYPHHFRAPGIMRSKSSVKIVNHAEGQISKIITSANTAVASGQSVLHLDNKTLDLGIEQTRSNIEELQARLRMAREQNPVFLQSLEQSLQAKKTELAELEKQKADLMVKTDTPGHVVWRDENSLTGLWIPRGSVIGEIVDLDNLVFSAIVSQKEAASLSESILATEVKLISNTERNLQGYDIQVITADQSDLPAASLGWLAGGDIEVKTNKDGGTQTVEPFYEVLIKLKKIPENTKQHQSGYVRFTLEPKPIIAQLWRQFRQLLQERYEF